MLKLWTYSLRTVVIPLRGEGCWVIVKKGKKSWMFFLLQSSQRSDATKTDRWTTKTLVKWFKRLGFLALDRNVSSTLKEKMEMSCYSSISKHICLLSLMPEEGLILKCFGRKLLKNLHLGCSLKAIVNIPGSEQWTMKLHLLLEISDSGRKKREHDFLQHGITFFFKYLIKLLFSLNKFFMITQLAIATQDDCKSEWCVWRPD